jgi:integrase/recombinase XerD
MKTTAKVILFPQLTKNGYPLKLRITQQRKSSYISLGYYLTKTDKARYWNSDTNELRKSYPNFEQVQGKVDEILKKQRIELEDEESVKTYLNNRSFKDYLNKKISDLEISGKFGSVQKLKTVRLHLNKFKEGDIFFNDLTLDFLNDFKIYLIGKNVKPISQRAYFERIRKLLNNAIKEDKYNPRKHPFTGFEFEKSTTPPKALTSKLLNIIEDAVFNESIKFIDDNPKDGNKTDTISLSTEIRKSGLMFLFQYYAYGMRVSDLLLLKWQNIYDEGDRLQYEMFKTKNQMDLKLTDNLYKILFHFLPEDTKSIIIKRDKKPISRTIRWHVRNISLDKEKRGNYIFGMLPDHEMSKREIYSKIQTYSSYYNRDLKLLAEQTHISHRIDFKLSSHTARHTFADLARLSGLSVYDISKALNHKSISTTEKYLNNFASKQLDDKFYTNTVDINDKNEINKRLLNLLESDDYKKKSAFLKMLEESTE